MKAHRKTLVAAIAILGLTALGAPAAVITFTHSGTGSGSLDGVPFTNAPFTITASGDLLPWAFSGGRAVTHDHASITIQGVGSFDLLSGTRTFVNNDDGIVGFSRAGASNADLFNGPTSAIFRSWDMESGIETVSGSGQLLQWSIQPEVLTTGGVLLFSTGDPTASFSAVVVPEPAGSMLLSFGAAALLVRRTRRGRDSR